MAAPAHGTNAVSQDTLITIKVSVNDNLKKLKLPLRDLGANVLPDKLRLLLGITPEQTVIFERFSDSAGGYITLDPNSPQVFKTLIRAAKAKLKLRLKATVSPPPPSELEQEPESAADADADADATETAEERVPPKPVEPVIVRSPTYQPLFQSRDSTALDRRSVGCGIFQFREARASQPTLIDIGDRQVHSSPADSQMDTVDGSSAGQSPQQQQQQQQQRELAFRGRHHHHPDVNNNNTLNNRHAWSVYCNECDVAMPDAHFHCNICDAGDYDLCERCVAGGAICPGKGHWLIKRHIKDGKVISSTTERFATTDKSHKPVKVMVEKQVPGAFAEDIKSLADEPRIATRTCNNCVVVLPEREFVTCTSCEDFDLCVKCHAANKHGHHPAHGFKAATEGTLLSFNAKALLAAGRNVRHNAICDGCDKKIYGVRHKCLNCPDWDYCNDCIQNARLSHPRHRFAAIYEPIADAHVSPARHFGIYCDGPLCRGKTDQSYITGVRYKCAVCNDVDFCDSCEALPANSHNRTHPLIKFKMPVRGVSITTHDEDARGCVRKLGDQRPSSHHPLSETKSASTETTPVQQANASTQVQILAEIEPTEEKKMMKKKCVLRAPGTKLGAFNAAVNKLAVTPLLTAIFVQDTVPDGKVVEAGARFTQIWTMRNSGPHAWPAGCSVHYVGGDNMLNVDNTHPSSTSDINNAKESNVVGRDVQVGEEVAFKVVLKAPTREGKCISYWRLKTAEGTPFGHRLWCDVEVRRVGGPQTPPTAGAKALPTAINAEAKALPTVANPPIDGAQQAHLLRMQSFRQQQIQTVQMQQQQMHKQQMQQQQIQRMLLAAQQQQQQAQLQMKQQQVCASMAREAGQTQQPPCQLPAHYASYTDPAAAIRAAGMRQQQAQRRESWLADINMPRDRSRAHLAGEKIAKLSSSDLHASILKKVEQLTRHGDGFPKVPTPTQDVAAVQSKDKPDGIPAMYEATERMSKKLSDMSLERSKQKQKASEEMEKAQKIIEQVNKDEEEEEEEEVVEEEEETTEVEHGDMKGSQMVFPKLDKESPASSTYQSVTSFSSKGKAAYVENEKGEIERSATPAAAAAPASAPAPAPAPVVASSTLEEGFDDLMDDLEVLSAEGNDSEDDGFLTDEEYDILDASDHEAIASP